jgi:hypothetical protein
MAFFVNLNKRTCIISRTVVDIGDVKREIGNLVDHRIKIFAVILFIIIGKYYNFDARFIAPKKRVVKVLATRN